MTTLTLRLLHDFDSEKVWYSKEINHGDWPFRFMLKLEYPAEWDDEAEKQYGKYYLQLLVVSPTAAKETDAYQSAMDSYGWTPGQVKQFGSLAEYEMMMSYGAAAHVWQGHGNNLASLLKQARKELREADFLFGFKMDRAQNAVGATGWDWVKGDVCGSLRA